MRRNGDNKIMDEKQRKNIKNRDVQYMSGSFQNSIGEIPKSIIREMEHESLRKQFEFIPSLYKLDDVYIMTSNYINRDSINLYKYITERNIKTLIHFTKVKNLDNILNYGILSTEELENQKIKYEANDNNRWDGFKDGIFLSITHPNIGLLKSFKERYSKCDWAVILLHVDILWEKDCLFSISNSAKSVLSKLLNENKDYGLNNIKYFKNLFKNNCGGYRRDKLDIRKNITTDPQSEVIVFNNIETRYIKGIHFENCIPERLKKYENYIKIKQSKNYFEER